MSGRATKPPIVKAPRAIPPPPAASAPPPNQAKIALWAAAPDKPAIAVPVEAAPSCATSIQAPVEAATPRPAPFPATIAASKFAIVSRTLQISGGLNPGIVGIEDR